MPENLSLHLIVLEGGAKRREVDVSKSPFRVGRAADNDLQIEDLAVSSHHFRLRVEGDNVLLDDLASSNGTFLDGREERVHTAPLHDRSSIRIGTDTQLTVHFGSSTPAAGRYDARQSVVLSSLRQLSTQVSEASRSMDAFDTRGRPARLRDLSERARKTLDQSAKAYSRLAAMYDATGHVISGSLDLEQCLEKVLDTALQTMGGERGFVMMRDQDTGTLEVKAARDVDLGTPQGQGSMGIAEQVAASGEPVLTGNAAQDFSGHNSVMIQSISSVLCVPLRLQQGAIARNIGVLYLDSRQLHGGFAPEDQELLSAFARLAAIAIENARLFRRLQEEERVRERLGRSLPRDVVQKLIDAGEKWGPGGDEQFVTILDCDIRGFTSISEQLTPQQTIELLNHYFSEMSRIVFAHNGTLDKFMGDGLMAIFGAPYSRGDDAHRAVQCAIEMVQQMSQVNAGLRTRNLPTLKIGIGLNSGNAIAGNVGSNERMDYTVVGDTVNVACRIQAEARPAHDGEEEGVILITDRTYDLVKDEIRAVSLGEIPLKGKAASQPVYKVVVSDEEAENEAR